MPSQGGGRAAGSTRRGSASNRRSSTSSTTSPTGLQLDEADPEDAKILARQRKAARAAGRQGQDRERVTRGRADLQAAYDEGAAAAAAEKTDEGEPAGDEPDEDEGQDDDEPDGPGRVRRGAARVGQGAGQAAGFLSRGSYAPTLTPPRRGRDAGGFALGALLYVAVITYIRYGPAGWSGWLSAKFLNKPLQGLPGKGGPATDTGGLQA